MICLKLFDSIVLHFFRHKLIYEGPLTWRQARGKTLDLQVILLEHLLVFLTKTGTDGTKLSLKIHEPGCIPIMRLSSVEVEEKTGDKRAFNLLYKCDLRVFELVAATATERKTYVHIHMLLSFYSFMFRWHRLIENQSAVSRQDLGEHPFGFDFLNQLPTQATASAGSQNATPSRNNNNNNSGADSPNSSAGGAHALAKVEHVHVLMHPSLVNANEITVQQPKILEHAQPMILTIGERLQRNDKMIINALIDKHNALSELLKENKVSRRISIDFKFIEEYF